MDNIFRFPGTEAQTHDDSPSMAELRARLKAAQAFSLEASAQADQVREANARGAQESEAADKALAERLAAARAKLQTKEVPPLASSTLDAPDPLLEGVVQAVAATLPLVGRIAERGASAVIARYEQETADEAALRQIGRGVIGAVPHLVRFCLGI